MAEQQSAGARFRQALKEEAPLQVMGTINAYAAMMAERVGYRAIYLSGGLREPTGRGCDPAHPACGAGDDPPPSPGEPVNGWLARARCCFL